MDSETELQALHHFMLYLFMVFFVPIEKTVRVIKLDIEHWSFASSNSSMLVSQFVCKLSVVHSVAQVYKTCFSLLSFCSWKKRTLKAAGNRAGLKKDRAVASSAVLYWKGCSLWASRLVHLTVTGFFS